MPFPVRSCESKLDEKSLRDVLSSSREMKYLKAHKVRSKPKGLASRKKLGGRWELDLTNKETIKIIKKLDDSNDAIDWAIFDFQEHNKHKKFLVIQKHGTGGCQVLASNLATINQMRYAVLAIVYGHLVKRRLILLIIWNPTMHNHNKNKGNEDTTVKTVQLNLRASARHQSYHSTTMLFWQHKEKIKTFANAKKELNINLHSKLAQSMIISQLHRDGLLDDIIIRVTKSQVNNSDANHIRNKSLSPPVKPTPVPRDWTLGQLKKSLCKEYGMDRFKIRLSLVANNVPNKRRKLSLSFWRTHNHHHIELEDDDKKLFELGIDHGSQIYITDEDDMPFHNSTIKKDRVRMWDQILRSERRDSLSGHRREQSLPVWLHMEHASSSPYVLDQTKNAKTVQMVGMDKMNNTGTVDYLPRSQSNRTDRDTPPSSVHQFYDNSAFTVDDPSSPLLVVTSHTTTTPPTDGKHGDVNIVEIKQIIKEQQALEQSDTQAIGSHHSYKNEDDHSLMSIGNRKKQLYNKQKQNKNSKMNGKRRNKKHIKRKRKHQKKVKFGNNNLEVAGAGVHINRNGNKNNNNHMSLAPHNGSTTSPSELSSLEEVSPNHDIISPPTDDIDKPLTRLPLISPPPSNHVSVNTSDAIPDSMPGNYAAPMPAPMPASSAPAPLPSSSSSAPAPIPMALSFAMPITSGSDESDVLGPLIPPDISSLSKPKRKLKSHLHELVETKEDDASSSENEEDLQPSVIFTCLETAHRSRRKSKSKSRSENYSPQIVPYSNDIPLQNGHTNAGDDQDDHRSDSPTPDSMSTSSSSDRIVPLPDNILIENDDLVQHDSNLDLNDIFITNYNVGRGKTASVHQALYKNTVFVAVKEFVFQKLSQAILEDFHKEANTLKNLRHPNIAMLVGSYLDQISGELYLVLEWLPGGCLHDLLHDDGAEIEISYSDSLLMAIDIARGMKYLHSKNIIHRDLKSHNLLLDEEYRVKVTDFGTAKHLSQIKSKAFTEVGTLGYVAPEVLDPPISGYDAKVDVFSFGVILWEIMKKCCGDGNEEDALSNISTLQYSQKLKTGFRPKIPDECPKEFADLISGCWEYKPQKRPSFHQIVLYLRELIKANQHLFNDQEDDEYDSDEDDDDLDVDDDDDDNNDNDDDDFTHPM